MTRPFITITSKTVQGYDIVNGKLDLPDGAHVYETLDLEGCRTLTSLPAGLTIYGHLNIAYCPSLKTLPDGLNVGGVIVTDHFEWDRAQGLLVLRLDLPETVIAGLHGMRVDQIIEHPWLRDLGLSEMIVTSAVQAEPFTLYLILEPALERAA